MFHMTLYDSNLLERKLSSRGKNSVGTEGSNMFLIPGRLDRKIEFPLPNEEARAHILRIHSRKMNVSSDVNFDELARCTDDFNGAQLKAVCVEAGMIALRRGATELIHEDYMEGIYVPPPPPSVPFTSMPPCLFIFSCIPTYIYHLHL